MDTEVVIALIGTGGGIIVSIISTIGLMIVNRSGGERDKAGQKKPRIGRRDIALILGVGIISFLLLYLIINQLLNNNTKQELANALDLSNDVSDWQSIWKLDESYNRVSQLSTDNIISPFLDTDQGIGYTLQTESSGQAQQYTVYYSEPLSKVDIISADVYIPIDEHISDNWVGIKVNKGANLGWAQTGKFIQPGAWTRLILDLRDQFDSSGAPLSDQAITLEITYLLVGGTETGSSSVGLDNVFAYRGAGIQSIHEQGGSNHILFDFENENIAGWDIGNNRDGIDTKDKADSPTYRGEWALKLYTASVTDSDAASIKTTLSESSAKGIWVAQVYAPETDVVLWANMFTYVQGDFTGSETVRLNEGEWTTLFWDTRDLTWNADEKVVMGIQFGATSGEFEGTVYFDDIYIFHD